MIPITSTRTLYRGHAWSGAQTPPAPPLTVLQHWQRELREAAEELRSTPPAQR